MNKPMLSRSVNIFLLLFLFFCFSHDVKASETIAPLPEGKGLSIFKPLETDFSVGMAKIDITPDIESRNVPFAGYFDRHGRPATSIHDPIYARAMVATDRNGNMFGLVSADLCYVHSEVRDRVVARLRPYGFSEDNLMIAATHNHSGFGGFDTRWVSTALFGDYDPRLQDLAVFGISSAVMQAKEKMEPAVIKIASTELPVGTNRSRRDPAFSVDNGGSQSKMDPEKYKTDRTLTVIEFINSSGDAIGAMYNFSSHPTVLSPKNFAISADWPGVANKKLESSFASGYVAMFLNGSLGDAAPRPDWDTLEKEWDSVESYGNEIADAVIGLLKNTKEINGNTIQSKTVRKEFANFIIRPLGKMKLTKYSSRIAYKRPDQPMQAIRFGNLVLMAAPGEPTTLVGNELKKSCPENDTCLVVAPANGYMGYFVVEEEWIEGGYAADSCMFGLKGTQNVIEGISEAVSSIK